MKTISYIVGVFVLGLFGWIGFENKNRPEEKPYKSVYQNDIRIIEAEHRCEILAIDISENQKAIEKKIAK